IIGMQPWVSASNIALPDDLPATDQDTSLHLETFFQWQVTNNLSLTPGILVIPNADYNSANGTLVIGAVRATFEF
ncbi:MAG: carbohydrate porin, partial [Cyanobacteriota bacterium]|nr:carbohydrate porin [Cyanobacteriota bacterium]